jgi:hypothetical protein
MRIAKQLFPTYVLIGAFLLSVGFPVQGMAIQMSSGLLSSSTSDSVESNSFITIIADGVETKISVGDPLPSNLTATTLSISGPVTAPSESNDFSMGNGSISISGSTTPSLYLTAPTLSLIEPAISNNSISIVADGVETTIPAGDPIPSNITATTLTISDPVAQSSDSLVTSWESFSINNNLTLSASGQATSVGLNNIVGLNSSNIITTPLTSNEIILTPQPNISISQLTPSIEITEATSNSENLLDESITSAKIKNGTIQFEDLNPSISISGKDDADGVEIIFSREFDYTYIPEGGSEAVTIKALDLNGTSLRINETDPTVTLGGQPRNVLTSGEILGTNPVLQQIIVDLPTPLLAGQYKLKLSNTQGNSELHIPLSNTTDSAE